MKHSVVGVIATIFALATVITAIATTLQAFREVKHNEPFLDRPLGQLHQTTVTCPGSASSATRVPATGTAVVVSSMTIINTSATCVQVGGSTVTSTTGGAVGSGCALGTVFPYDGKEMYCVSSAVGSQAITVLYGAQ